MLKFYDTKDNLKEHAKAEAELREVHKKYTGRGDILITGDRMYDLGNYVNEQ